MLSWAITLLILAAACGFAGATGLAGELVWLANLLFVAFLVLFLVTLVASFARGRRSSQAHQNNKT